MVIMKNRIYRPTRTHRVQPNTSKLCPKSITHVFLKLHRRRGSCKLVTDLYGETGVMDFGELAGTDLTHDENVDNQYDDWNNEKHQHLSDP